MIVAVAVAVGLRRAAVPHADRHADAGDGRRPGAGRADRRRPEPGEPVRLDLLHPAGGDRRHPDRAGADAGRHPALAADRQRLHRGRLRPAAEPADDVRRRGRGRAPAELPHRLPAAATRALQGLQVAAPALLLFLALLVFPHGRLRGKSVRLHPVPVPTLRGTAVFAAAIVAFGVVLATVLSQADLITYGAIFSFGLIALSLVPLGGYAGQISLCQLSMAAIGALTWAHLAPERAVVGADRRGRGLRRGRCGRSRCPPCGCPASTWPWAPPRSR